MPRTRTQISWENFERERQEKYRGSASISLDAIDLFSVDPSTLDRKNVERLKEVFRNEDCQRQPVTNHILVLVDQACFEAALESSGASAPALLAAGSDEYPKLRFPAGVRLACLHGRHRVQAGREFLPPHDKWWIADLYLTGEYGAWSTTVVLISGSDLSADARWCLIEEYANERIPSDGEIYQKIRHYHFQRNLAFELRWWARLRGCRTKNLKALLRSIEFAAAFDSLLDIPGLWNGFQLTTLHKILSLRSDEVGC